MLGALRRLKLQRMDQVTSSETYNQYHFGVMIDYIRRDAPSDSCVQRI